ncbi:hypothetical protein BH11ACT3_BH11ACT3_04880 [soil metagenome]
MSASAPLAPWVLPGSRAVLALALGLVITFNADHSAPLGLVVFGVFAVATAAAIGAASWRSPADTTARGSFLAQAAVTLVAGIAALVRPDGGVHYLVLVVSGWAIIAGALELVSGIRARGRAFATSDWIITGALTVLLGIVVLVVPPDLAVHFEGEKGVEGMLTSSIVIVGVLGFWGIITGVLLGIAAASPRQRAQSPAEHVTTSVS